MSFAWINSFIIVVGNPLAFRFYFRAFPCLADISPAKAGGTCESQTARNSDEPAAKRLINIICNTKTEVLGSDQVSTRRLEPKIRFRFEHLAFTLLSWSVHEMPVIDSRNLLTRGEDLRKGKPLKGHSSRTEYFSLRQKVWMCFCTKQQTAMKLGSQKAPIKTSWSF